MKLPFCKRDCLKLLKGTFITMFSDHADEYNKYNKLLQESKLFCEIILIINNNACSIITDSRSDQDGRHAACCLCNYVGLSSLILKSIVNNTVLYTIRIHNIQNKQIACQLDMPHCSSVRPVPPLKVNYVQAIGLNKLFA